MKIEVKNGDLSLIKSDTILVFENQDVSLLFDEQYHFVFHFEEDSTIQENKMEFENIEDGIKLVLTNFNNPIGTSTTRAIPFAETNGKVVFVSFAVYTINKTKVLHYNIYTGN